jgi:phage terminase large subunit-like protein
VPDFPLLREEPFKSEAERALRVFGRLRLPDVIGNPTMAEAAGEWFFPIVAALFGSYDPRQHTRLIRELFLLMPKGNGKSSYAAMIMLTALILNRRPRGEFLLIAPTQKIAETAFNQASGAIYLDDALKKTFHPTEHLKLITHRLNKSTLRIKAAGTDVITGAKAVGTLVDETHLFAEKARGADIFVELRGSLSKRPDGFLIQITTQSKRPPSGVFKTELYNARDVRDGKLDLPLLPVLYELPERLAKDGAWKDRKYWPLLNPNLGRSLGEDFLAQEIVKAERVGPQQVALIASQHFDVEVGIGYRTDGWPGVVYWERRALPDLTLDGLLDRCESVVVGLDGGGLDDLFGLAVLGRERETKRWLHWGHAWCHEGVLKLRQSIAPQLHDFAAAGDLTIVGDKLEDISEIVALIERIQDLGLLAAVAVDPAGLGEMVDALAEIGVTEDNKLLIGVPQGYALMNAIKTCERKLANGTLHHCGQGLVSWSIGNVKIEPMATAIRATKQNAGDAKIDPAMALFDAAYWMTTNPEAQGQSIYDDPARYEAAFGRGPAPQASEAASIDYEILRDSRHPRFAEMRERWEAWRALQPDDDMADA